MAKQVSLTYGNALFELARDEGKIDQILEEVLAVRQIFKDNEELVRILNHPKIVKEEKIAIVENIFKNRISDDVIGIIVIMIKKDRYSNITQVIDYYENAVKKYKNIGVAYITSAVTLSETQKNSIEQRLLDTTSYTQIEAIYNVDEVIIGGLVIRIEDRVVDSSIKTKIESLSKSLYQG